MEELPKPILSRIWECIHSWFEHPDDNLDNLSVLKEYSASSLAHAIIASIRRIWIDHRNNSLLHQKHIAKALIDNSINTLFIHTQRSIKQLPWYHAHLKHLAVHNEAITTGEVRPIIYSLVLSKVFAASSTLSSMHMEYLEENLEKVNKTTIEWNNLDMKNYSLFNQLILKIQDWLREIIESEGHSIS